MLSVAACAQLGWTKATASEALGLCVEVAPHREGIALRDSKSPSAGAFLYSRDEFAAFVDGCRRGEFDHLLGPAT